MQPKDVSTVRVSQLEPGVRGADLRQFFGRHKLITASCMSICPSVSSESKQFVATVTFDAPSEAKKAVQLDGQFLRESSLSIERDFRGLTVLACPSEPSVE